MFYSNFVIVYYVIGEFEKLVEYEVKVLVINDEIGDKLCLSIFYNNFGRIYYIFGKDKELIDCFKKGFDIKRELNDREG